MTNTERIIKFCVEYFNKHDLDTDDEPITSDDISIMSYADIGMGWSAVVYMPNGYIYDIGTLENIYGAVALNKYRRVGGSLYKWEETAKHSECKKCPAYIKEANRCSWGIVINLAKYGKI